MGNRNDTRARSWDNHIEPIPPQMHLQGGREERVGKGLRLFLSQKDARK